LLPTATLIKSDALTAPSASASKKAWACFGSIMDVFMQVVGRCDGSLASVLFIIIIIIIQTV
jgi:hypothetical protein